MARLSLDDLITRALDAAAKEYPNSDPAEVLLAILRAKTPEPEKMA